MAQSYFLELVDMGSSGMARETTLYPGTLGCARQETRKSSFHIWNNRYRFGSSPRSRRTNAAADWWKKNYTARFSKRRHHPS